MSGSNMVRKQASPRRPASPAGRRGAGSPRPGPRFCGPANSPTSRPRPETADAPASTSLIPAVNGPLKDAPILPTRPAPAPLKSAGQVPRMSGSNMVRKQSCPPRQPPRPAGAGPARLRPSAVCDEKRAGCATARPAPHSGRSAVKSISPPPRPPAPETPGDRHPAAPRPLRPERMRAGGKKSKAQSARLSAVPHAHLRARATPKPPRPELPDETPRT